MLYQVRVRGHLDAGWTDWLGGLSITAEPDGNTLLAGPLPDQAALYSILYRLYSLNLQLLSVQDISSQADEMPGEKQRRNQS